MTIPIIGTSQFKGTLECEDEFLAYRLGARRPGPAYEVPMFIVLPAKGPSLIWPFVADDVKDLNRRTTA